MQKYDKESEQAETKKYNGNSGGPAKKKARAAGRQNLFLIVAIMASLDTSDTEGDNNVPGFDQDDDIYFVFPKKTDLANAFERVCTSFQELRAMTIEQNHHINRLTERTKALESKLAALEGLKDEVKQLHDFGVEQGKGRPNCSCIIA